MTRLSYTYNHGEGIDHEILALVDIQPTDKGTRVTWTNRFRSREQRDAARPYGAEAGAKAALRALAAVVEEA